MASYVEVAINLPQISDPFHYHLPDDLADSVGPGSLVIVPFGKQRAQGVVLRRVERPEVSKTKPVAELVDEKPALTPSQIELAQWIAEETLAPLGACINLMLPPGLSQRTDTLVRLNPNRAIDEESLSPLEKRIVHLLQDRGDLRGRQINASLRHVEWRGTVRKLARAGIVHTQSILPPTRVRPKTVRKAKLAIPPEQIKTLPDPLSRVEKVHERRLRVLRFLANEPGLVEPSWIYAQTGANNGDLKMLAEAGLIILQQAEVWRDPLSDATYVPDTIPTLTQDQTKAWQQIQQGLAKARQGEPVAPFLIHGVTGSGKTELYLRAVQETLEAGKTALILVPEISLTPQTIKRFLARFPDRVGVIHSQLSEGERYDTWRRVRKGDLSLIIGPRSALFMPLENLGLIVVDECHHESYDQSDSLPYYHAVRTAVACARLNQAAILLGSATPRVTQYYQAVSGPWNLIELPRRILAHRDAIAHQAQRLGIEMPALSGEGEAADLGLPKVSIVDMRQELVAGNRSIFSRDLRTGIKQVLERDQQAILFLNRRGTSTYVFCRECGHVVKCPRDDKPLTYHSHGNQLVCHTCGYTRKMPRTCPQCGSTQIRQLGTGTEKVEELVKEQFPTARVLRWDAETTRKKGAHELILNHFTNHKADILIGTQMLAKGLDLPLVTLVGVILAEIGLNLPDYRAGERSFQVLTQVAGRAGRSPLGGNVILQTYEPDNYAIQSAAQHDFEGFYQKEMDFRRLVQYPPFSRLVRLEYRNSDARKAKAVAESMAGTLREWIRKDNSRIEIIGPAPCFFTKLYGRYRWQIVLKGQDPASLLRTRTLTDWSIEVDPASLL
jgi:primosomal protein N' (replication factor Y)